MVMGRSYGMNTRLVRIDEIKVIGNYYPRATIWTEDGTGRSTKSERSIPLNTSLVNRYEEAYDLGKRFPPIAVSLFKKEYVLVDGLHRLAVYKRKMFEMVRVTMVDCSTEKELYLKAIELNINHGQPFTDIDLKWNGQQLQRMGFKQEEVRKILGTNIDELKKIVDSPPKMYNQYTNKLVLNQEENQIQHFIINYESCPTCNGSGRIPKK